MIDMLKGTVTPKDWAAVGAILAATILLMAVFVFFIHAEQEQALAALVEERRTVEADLAIAEETRANIEALEEETEMAQALVDEFERRLPHRREIPQLLEEFEGLAQEVGLDIEMTPRPRIVDMDKETIPYAITAYGDFHQIASFINRLERFERYLKVSELSISEQRQGVASATFTLSTYRFLEEQPAPQQTAQAGSGGGAS